MFKQAIRWVLLPAAAAVLAACGGGGGGGGGPTSSTQPSNFAVPVVINAVPPQK
jgi:hypothetical protein